MICMPSLCAELSSPNCQQQKLSKCPMETTPVSVCRIRQMWQVRAAWEPVEVTTQNHYHNYIKHQYSDKEFFLRLLAFFLCWHICLKDSYETCLQLTQRNLWQWICSSKYYKMWIFENICFIWMRKTHPSIGPSGSPCSPRWLAASAAGRAPPPATSTRAPSPSTACLPLPLRCCSRRTRPGWRGTRPSSCPEPSCLWFSGVVRFWGRLWDNNLLRGIGKPWSMLPWLSHKLKHRSMACQVWLLYISSWQFPLAMKDLSQT